MHRIVFFSLRFPTIGRCLVFCLANASLWLFNGPAMADDTPVDFQTQVQPILEAACLQCHDADSDEGELRLDTLAELLAGGSSGATVVAGQPDESSLYTRTVLAVDDDQLMPPESPLSTEQTEVLRQWIAEGAVWPADVTLETKPRIDFATHIQPILEQNCISCHQSGNAEADLDLSTRAAATTGGSNGPALIPFNLKSPLLTLTLLSPNNDSLMPPADKGGPLDRESIELLTLWISQGAPWPDGPPLQATEKKVGPKTTFDDLELVRKINELILQTQQRESALDAAYEGTIPQTGVAYQMVPIPGGKFLMGSPPAEPDRKDDEGPQQEVTIDPFWIGKYEVTWDEYEPFMITQVDREKHGGRKDYDPNTHPLVDGVSQPTPPYTEMSFGMGQRGFPAISMTQHAANKYCQWLSAQTGHFYRLPTEAEWEYACRAGTTTPFSFGDEPIDDYAWFYENSNEKYQKVGQKKPNPFGLYDMHGNVMEWCADQYVSDYFLQIGTAANNPWIKPSSLYPRTVRGGGWDDDAEQLRSAARRGSDKSWKQQDPQLPKSIWYHTDARWLGFRIVRPVKIPTPEEMYFYWNSASGAK
jgi:formylglycine-generating enzyme required for sulfatase activity